MTVEHHLRTPLGDVAQLVHGDREKICGQREWLSVKVAGRVGEAPVAPISRGPVRSELQVERLALARKEQRIVGRSIDLTLGDRSHELKRLARGAVDLWRA